VVGGKISGSIRDDKIRFAMVGAALLLVVAVAFAVLLVFQEAGEPDSSNATESNDFTFPEGVEGEPRRAAQSC